MDYVKIDKKGHIAVVTFCRPPMNAVDYQAYAEIGNAFRMINKMPEISVAILRAEGKGFCAGHDVGKLHNSDDAMNLDNMMVYPGVVNDSYRALNSCKAVVIGAIHGFCVAAGVAYASQCDMLICSDDAYFRLSEVLVGVVAGGCFASLLFPEKYARYMAITGRKIPASEAVRFGSVLKTVPREQLDAEAMALAEEIAGLSPTALSLLKTNMNMINPYNVEVKERIEHLGSVGPLERAECVRAFKEKRPGNFTLDIIGK